MMNDITNNRFQEIVRSLPKIKPILVAGDVGIDKYTYGVVERISPEAPVPVLEVTKEWKKLGLAANVSDNLSSLGLGSTLCGVVGNDSLASDFESLLEEKGLRTWGIIRTNRPTILKERVTTVSQQICRIDYESTTDMEESEEKKFIDRIDDFIDDHGGLIIEDYGKGTLTKNIIEDLIKRGQEKNLLITVDPSRKTPPLYYKGATVLKPNRAESLIMAEALGYREKNIETIANLLLDKLALEKVVITLGGEGMALLDSKASDKIEYIPTLASEVFDVSGAGDTVISVLTAALSAGAGLKEAAWIANCAASVVVGKKGTATVNMDELSKSFEVLSKR